MKGVSRVKSLEILLNIGNIELTEDEKQSMLIKKNEEYLEYVHQMTSEEILPGVLHLLDFLDEHQIKYALGSASKNAPLILEKVGLLKRFTALVDGNDVSKAKPNPEVFLIAAQKLKTAPENCIVVEDAIAGVEAAKLAKMTCVGIGNQQILNKADVVFKDMTGFSLEFLKELINN